MSAEIRAVLFDKDGTLIDYAATWVPTNWLVARRVAGGDEGLAGTLLAAGGHDPETDAVRPHSVLSAGSASDLARLWSPLLGGRDVSALTEVIDQGFLDGVAASMTTVCDLEPLLSFLRGAGLVLGVATSDSEAAARHNLALLELEHHFPFVCGYDSGHGEKPGPGMIEAFCRAVDLPAAAVAMVGDSYHDLEMARAAGAGLAVGVLTGPAERGELETQADVVIADVRGLPSILDLPGFQ